MDTNELIAILSKTPQPVTSLNQSLANAGSAALLIAAFLFLFLIGFRPDIGAAVQSGRFLLKFVITLALAISSGLVLFTIGKPGAPLKKVSLLLFVPLMVALGAVALELCATPPNLWMVRAIGHNAINCLTLIPLLSVVPLGCLLVGMQQGAPQNPGLAGLVAGLVSAGIAATFYAANCDDDSPLFVLLWYSPSIAVVSLLGFIAGRLLLRW